MKVNEYGTEHEKTIAMFQCAAEPGWAFMPSAEALAQDYHVFLFIADGHDELGTTFKSVEKYADDAASWLKEKGIPADSSEKIQRSGSCGACTDVSGSFSGRGNSIP